MKHDKIEHWIIEWFKEHNSNPQLNIPCDIDFYNQGILDSFGIIELVDAIEQHFTITFSDEDFQTPDFKTITGLKRLIQLRQ